MFPFAGKSKSCPVFPDSITNLDQFSHEASRYSDTTVPSSTSLTSPNDFPSLPTHSLRCSSRIIQPPIWTKDFSCHTLSQTNTTSCSYPISNYIDYSKFSQTYQSFLTEISSLTEPRFCHEAITDPR